MNLQIVFISFKKHIVLQKNNSLQIIIKSNTMNKKIFIFILIISSQIISAQTILRSKFKPLSFEEMITPLKIAQEKYNNNSAKVDALINWIFELKKNTNETEFTLRMDYFYKELKSYYEKDIDLARMDAQIKQVELGIKEAIDSYNTRVSEAPKRLWESGNNSLNNNNLSQAISDYNSLIQISPNFFYVFLNRGFAYYQQKNYSASLSDLNKYIESKSDNPSAFNYRGWTKHYLNDNMGALKDFNRLIELEPSSYEAYYSRGSVKSDLSDEYGAISDYTKSIEIKPDFSMGYNNRGWAKFKLKNYSEALIDLNRSIELDPLNWVAYDSRQETKFALNDLKGCLDDCNQALTFNPKLSNSYFYRGRVNYRLGKKTEACDDWSKAGELGLEKAYEAISSYCK